MSSYILSYRLYVLRSSNLSPKPRALVLDQDVPRNFRSRVKHSCAAECMERKYVCMHVDAR